jgi:CDP-paratose 2-epimerase
MKTVVFRGGCLTGAHHSGVELHGFLSYLVKMALCGGKYTIFGHKGKQVRDQIHCADVVSAFDAFAADPKPGEVYNLGGGRDNSASILECLQMLESRMGRRLPFAYEDMNRRGDHICYISDLRKFQRQFPTWRITRSLDAIVDEIVQFERARIESDQRTPVESRHGGLSRRQTA